MNDGRFETFTKLLLRGALFMPFSRLPSPVSRV